MEYVRVNDHLNVLEHVRVVADLPQLHNSVHQSLSAPFAL